MLKKIFFLLGVLMLIPLDGLSNPSQSIVKIYTTYDRPNFMRPWQMKGQTSSTGSGCIIAGQRILTNAHVIADHTFIQVRRAGKAEKFVAQVEAVSHELDLALLKVKDPQFFKGTQALEIGDLPKVGDRIVTFGFPKGGTRITVTKGVVSRIERSHYSHSQLSNLIAQIDAAINPGSSGGPAITADGKIGGVSFQGNTTGQNIGYVIPAPVVRHFLKDLEDKKHHGVPVLPIVTQTLENKQHRDYYAMKRDQSGILITEVSPLFNQSKFFAPLDIILSADGYDIANDGTIEFRKGERISYRYLIDRKQIGDSVTMKVLRAGSIKSLNIPLKLAKTEYGTLIDRIKFETLPTYYIIGGLVFTPLTTNYLLTWTKWAQVPTALKSYYDQIRTKENQDIKDVVLLMDVLPDESNVGYLSFRNSVVDTVNGKRIRSMRDLVDAFEKSKHDFFRVILKPYNGEIVFKKDILHKRNQEILKKYKIEKDRSHDL